MSLRRNVTVEDVQAELKSRAKVQLAEELNTHGTAVRASVAQFVQATRLIDQEDRIAAREFLYAFVESDLDASAFVAGSTETDNLITNIESAILRAVGETLELGPTP